MFVCIAFSAENSRNLVESTECELKSCTVFDYNLVTIGRLRIDPRRLRTARRRNDSFAKQPVTKVRAIFISFLILLNRNNEICEQWEKEEVIKTSWWFLHGLNILIPPGQNFSENSRINCFIQWVLFWSYFDWSFLNSNQIPVCCKNSVTSRKLVFKR